MRCPSFNMKFKVKFSEADIPDVAAWRADPDTFDKYCPICYLDGMDLGDIIMHLSQDHLLNLTSPLEKWQEAKEEYGTDSEEEEDVEQVLDAPSTDFTHPYALGAARESDSSQDSSAESVAESRASSRKRRRQRKSSSGSTDISESVESTIQKNLGVIQVGFREKNRRHEFRND